MKTLGTTVDGKFIVEMTPDEHYSFYKVEASINGTFSFALASPQRVVLQGTNLAPIFKALDDLVETKVSISQIKEYVRFLDKVFGGST